MTFEADLFTLLKTVTPRVYPDFAPVSTVRPYATYQHIGGQALRFLDNTAADKRNTVVQINVWSNTRLESLTLIRQIEDAMCASLLFVATPGSEPICDYDADIPVFGAIQDFSVFATR